MWVPYTEVELVCEVSGVSVELFETFEVVGRVGRDSMSTISEVIEGTDGPTSQLLRLTSKLTFLFSGFLLV